MDDGKRILGPGRDFQSLRDDLPLAGINASRFELCLQGRNFVGQNIEGRLCFVGGGPAELIPVFSDLLPQCRGFLAELPDQSEPDQGQC